MQTGEIMIIAPIIKELVIGCGSNHPLLSFSWFFGMIGMFLLFLIAFIVRGLLFNNIFLLFIILAIMVVGTFKGTYYLASTIGIRNGTVKFAKTEKGVHLVISTSKTLLLQNTFRMPYPIIVDSGKDMLGEFVVIKPNLPGNVGYPAKLYISKKIFEETFHEVEKMS